MDEKILKKLGIDYKYEIDLMDSHIFQKVNSRIKNIKDSRDICSECCWTHVCLWFKEAQKEL